jgi:hypothetical protein
MKKYQMIKIIEYFDIYMVKAYVTFHASENNASLMNLPELVFQNKLE